MIEYFMSFVLYLSIINWSRKKSQTCIEDYQKNWLQQTVLKTQYRCGGLFFLGLLLQHSLDIHKISRNFPQKQRTVLVLITFLKSQKKTQHLPCMSLALNLLLLTQLRKREFLLMEEISTQFKKIIWKICTSLTPIEHF